MYIEHRQYTFHPGKLPVWMEAYRELGGPASASTMGAPSLGFFTAEVGTINRVVFMRGWDDIDAREAGLAAREADPDWQEFRKRSGAAGALASQEVNFTIIPEVPLRFETFLPALRNHNPDFSPWKSSRSALCVDYR